MYNLLLALHSYVSRIIALVYGLKLSKASILRFPFSIKRGGFIRIGEGSFIGKRSKLFVYEKNNKQGLITIGSNFCAQSDLYLSSLGNITIGDDVLIGSYVTIIDNDHQVTPGVKGFPDVTVGNITIGNNVWIAEKCIILKNVEIGDYSIIGAGSVVTKDIPPCSIAVGVPAKVIKTWDSKENKWVSVS